MADAASVESGLPSFRFPLAAQPARVTAGGGARGHSVANFPAGKNIAGVSMWLHPGGLRELHWHPNAAEWGYVLTNRCRITLFDPDGTYEAWDLDAGDVWYFPRGYGHAVQGLGPGDCQFLLLFDNGAFQEDATFSITDWLARTSGEAWRRLSASAPARSMGFPRRRRGSSRARSRNRSWFRAKSPQPHRRRRGCRTSSTSRRRNQCSIPAARYGSSRSRSSPRPRP